MAFQLRSSRLRDLRGRRLRGVNTGVTISLPSVSSGNAVAGVSPYIRFATHGNPAPRPRVMLPVASVTASPSIGILAVGVPVGAPGVSPSVRVQPGDRPVPKAVTGVVSGIQRAAGPITESPKSVHGVAPNPDDQTTTAPTPSVPAPVIVPEVPKKRPGAIRVRK